MMMRRRRRRKRVEREKEERAEKGRGRRKREEKKRKGRGKRERERVDTMIYICRKAIENTNILLTYRVTTRLSVWLFLRLCYNIRSTPTANKQ